MGHWIRDFSTDIRYCVLSVLWTYLSCSHTSVKHMSFLVATLQNHSARCHASTCGTETVTKPHCTLVFRVFILLCFFCVSKTSCLFCRTVPPQLSVDALVAAGVPCWDIVHLHETRTEREKHANQTHTERELSNLAPRREATT